MKPMSKPMPTGKDRKGWHEHYVKVFNKTLTADSATLACWYLIMHLAELDGDY